MLLLALATPTGCGKRTRLEDRAVTLNAADGTSIAAHFYIPAQANAPGLILVHRFGADHLSWEPFAVRAQQAGYRVIALDLRGHGASRGAPDAPLDHTRFTSADWQRAHLDLGAAMEHLIEHGADPENLFIAGEAMGASLALQFAAEVPEIQGLVMISPGLDYHGIEAEPLIAAMARRPTLLVWSEGDAYAAASGDTLKRLAPGHIEVHAYPGAAHGTNVLSASPQAGGQILSWLGQMRSPPPKTYSAPQN